MGSGGQEERSSPGEVAWNVAELARAAEAAAGTSVLVATDAATVAGAENVTAVVRSAAMAGRTAVDAAA
eukprot:3535537-Pleurochrysis_carterae.AAC.1